MPEYGFYTIRKNSHIDGPGTGHILADDLAAIAVAKSLIDGHDVEIWQGPRVVAYLVPDEE